MSDAVMHVSGGLQPIFRELGIDAGTVFDHPLIKPWRTLGDRENCTLDATLDDGRRVRWHVKRYAPPPPPRRAAGMTAAEAEVAGLRLLDRHGIPTVPLVSWGKLDDGRSFIILDDLAGFEDAEKLLARGGATFEQLIEPTAQLAARLHNAGLHHRDLYLCHFFAKVGNEIDLRLIDTARVRELPRFFPRRWIVKDLAQFYYSTMSLPITDEQRERWLRAYCRDATGTDLSKLSPAIRRKVRRIERHDRALRQRQPTRNISIPS